MRKILYLSGSRADFGLIRDVLIYANSSNKISISICITGEHLLEKYGNTSVEIESSGLKIAGKIPVVLDGKSGKEMAKACGTIISSFVDIIVHENPDIVLVLGDRGEMLSAALAAVYMNRVIVHIHGGERSGTVDEPIRHAISKLSHYHFVATDNARQRLIKMGESSDNIYVTGAPGLFEIKNKKSIEKKELFIRYGFQFEKPLSLFIFHPVVQEIDNMEEQASQILSSLKNKNIQTLILLPNSDAGAVFIEKSIAQYECSQFKTVRHVNRTEFISFMLVADFMIGNSSSGIIEAASFGLWVINVGKRQHFRERSSNVIDVEPIKTEIENAINTVLNKDRYQEGNIYGDDSSGIKIIDHLSKISLDNEVLNKCNDY